MPAKVIIVSSALPGAGKTHFAAGLTCWLRQEGHHSAPLHLSGPAGDAVPCPEGGAISRAATLLSEAAGLMPEMIYESGWGALAELRQRFDTVVVETAAGSPVPAEWHTVRLSRSEGRIRPGGLASLPEFQPDLMPGYGTELEALPAWRLADGPRCGVITLPHMDNFSDYQLLRGSEWLTAPAVGRFANLFLPATANVASDLEWLAETGLAAWISAQRAAGARLSVCGWDYEGATHCERGDPLDFRFLSAFLRRRISPPLPDEQMHGRLAEWFGRWPTLGEFARACL